MSQLTNTIANLQAPLSTSINPAGILGHRTFRLSSRNSGNLFYNVFRKLPMDSSDILTTISSTIIYQEHWSKYAQPDKFERDLRNYQKWKENCLLYMLAYNNNFPDKYTTIMFMLYYIDKKALVWRTEFMAAHIVSGQGIYLPWNHGKLPCSPQLSFSTIQYRKRHPAAVACSQATIKTSGWICLWVQSICYPCRTYRCLVTHLPIQTRFGFQYYHTSHSTRTQ